MDTESQTTSSLVDILKDTFGSCYVCDCEKAPLIDVSREHHEPRKPQSTAALPKAALESKALPTLLKKQDAWFPDTRKIIQQAAGQRSDNHVHFRCKEQDSIKDDFTPYALKYGVAPAEFHFGADGDMIPTANTKMLDRVTHALGLGFAFSLPPSFVPRSLGQHTQSLKQQGPQASEPQKSMSLGPQSSQAAVPQSCQSLAPRGAQLLMQRSKSLPMSQPLVAAAPQLSQVQVASLQKPQNASLIHKSSTIDSAGSKGSLSCRAAHLHQPVPQRAYHLQPFAASPSPQDSGYQTPRFFLS